MELLFKPAKPDIDAFNETRTLSEIGCDTFGPKAWVELRPLSQAPGGIRFRANIAQIWQDTMEFIQYTAACGPPEDALDPDHVIADHPIAVGLPIIHHPMISSYVVEFGGIKILDHPATAEDVALAASSSFSVVMPSFRRIDIPDDYVPEGASDDDGAARVFVRKTKWSVVDITGRDFPGFDLAEGSDELLPSGNNLWKLVELAPSISLVIANFCMNAENFPKMADPTMPSTSGAAGVSTTSTSARPRNGAKKTRKPGGGRRSSPKQPTN